MKKLLLIATIAFSLHAMGQTGTPKTNAKTHPMRNCVMMKDGKMMEMMNGQTMPMDSMMTMRDGTVVMTDGMVKTSDGDMVQLKEGDCLYTTGEIKKAKKKAP